MDIVHLIKSGTKLLFDKDYRFRILAAKGKYNDMPDEAYLKRLYKATFGKELDLENPQTFNEKLQWLKLYYHRPDYTMMADKVAVRPYIAQKIGEEHLVPLLGVWDDPDDIDFDDLPDQFVLRSLFSALHAIHPAKTHGNHCGEYMTVVSSFLPA